MNTTFTFLALFAGIFALILLLHVHMLAGLVLELINPKWHVRLGVPFKKIVLETRSAPGLKDRSFKQKGEVGRFIFEAGSVYIYQRLISPILANHTRSVFSIRMIGEIRENDIILKVRFSLSRILLTTILILLIVFFFIHQIAPTLSAKGQFIGSVVIFISLTIFLGQSWFSMEANTRKIIKELKNIVNMAEGEEAGASE